MNNIDQDLQSCSVERDTLSTVIGGANAMQQAAARNAERNGIGRPGANYWVPGLRGRCNMSFTGFGVDYSNPASAAEQQRAMLDARIDCDRIDARRR
jgi:hypothetical protein